MWRMLCFDSCCRVWEIEDFRADSEWLSWCAFHQDIRNSTTARGQGLYLRKKTTCLLCVFGLFWKRLEDWPGLCFELPRCSECATDLLRVVWWSKRDLNCWFDDIWCCSSNPWLLIRFSSIYTKTNHFKEIAIPNRFSSWFSKMWQK